MSKPRLIISAGGTGGHIFPALAIAAQLANEYEIVWVGASGGMETQIVPQHGYPLHCIKIGGIRNKGLWRKLMLPWRLTAAMLNCLRLLLTKRPCLVIGFGGYATFPISLAARMLAIPLLIHEQNSVAGLTNRLLARIASKVLTAFPQALPGSKTVVVGNPVRQEILNLKNIQSSARADGKLRILIIGGSLGASILNEIVPTALAMVKQQLSAIVHQVGRRQSSEVSTHYAELGLMAQVVEFIDDMANAYANADLVICRAGASTVAEIACAGKAAIFIPYLYAVDDHQTANANYLVKDGGGWLLPQPQLTAANLANLLSSISLSECHKRGACAAQLAIWNSSELICQQIRQLSA